MSHIQPERYSKANNTQTVHAHPIFMRLNNFMASSILDIGSGDGKLTSKLKGLYPESQVIGIDISQEMVSYAKKNYANIDFMQADATRLTTIGQFDLITCFSTAHWIADQYSLFSKVKQNLKNGGRFLGFLYPVCKIQLGALQQVIELKRYSQYFSRAFEPPYFDHQIETYKQIKALAISGCGAGIEYYDFAIFAYFTPILAKAFFPEESTTLGVLYAFIILALGYFVRPIGGFIFGIIGDRYGRKKSFFFTMLTLAIATFIMAIMPTTQDIGIVAAIIFALLRIVQGIAIGGEIPTAITYSVEYFPKRKGFAVSIIFSCLGLGILLSTFMFMLVSNIPSSSILYDYGWRIAFIFGATLSILIYFLRKNLYETPDFMALIQQPMNLKAKKHFISSIAIGVLLVAPAAILTTQLFLFLPSYASTYLGMSKNILSDHIFYGSCIMILGCLLGGLISDHINKKILFCFLLLLICLLSYIFYNQLIDRHLNTLLLMLIFAFFGMLASTYTVIIAKISQANFRCRSIGLSYNLSYSIFSAPIPALSILILDSTNLIMLPFWLIALSSIIGIIGTVATLSIWKNINQHQTLACNQTT